MRINNFIAMIIPLAAVLSLSPAVRAERPAGPCQQDVQKLCPGVTRGGGAMRACLKQHAADLSPACQEHLKQAKAKLEAWRQACQSDVKTFCADVAPGGGNILKCLHQHHDQLSQSCQDQMAQARRQWRRHHGAATQPGPTPSAQ